MQCAIIGGQDMGIGSLASIKIEKYLKEILLQHRRFCWTYCRVSPSDPAAAQSIISWPAFDNIEFRQYSYEYKPLYSFKLCIKFAFYLFVLEIAVIRCVFKSSRGRRKSKEYWRVPAAAPLLLYTSSAYFLTTGLYKMCA